MYLLFATKFFPIHQFKNHIELYIFSNILGESQMFEKENRQKPP